MFARQVELAGPSDEDGKPDLTDKENDRGALDEPSHPADQTPDPHTK